TLLLPPLPRLLRSETLGEKLARLLGRGDRLDDLPESRAGQLEVLFDIEPRPLAAAALTRAMESDGVDAGEWLRADPAHVMVDIAAVRLMVCGDFGLTSDEVRPLHASLAALFAEEGLQFEAPATDRWYLRLPAAGELPAFQPPECAPGADMEHCLPEGAEQSRWRRLLNETQVLLHGHPVNVARAANGLLPVNSLWFWGAGRRPTRMRGGFSTVVGDDPLLRALAVRGGMAHANELAAEAGSGALVDLASAAETDLEAWLHRAARGADLVFAGGERFSIAGWQRWRFWRSPVRTAGQGA
ncbi:MAG TPA: phosphoglycerate mutase, partial [Xanthomonadaceae bacterium]|nr:phosphoglycerate mutase [Xanthomonadaceae bacterium]